MAAINWDDLFSKLSADGQEMLTVLKPYLPALAREGLPETQIMTLSRHPDPATLRRYLAAGRFNNAEAALQIEAATINESPLLNAC